MNRNAIPFDERPPINPSGLRIGTPALTTRGLVEEDMGRSSPWRFADDSRLSKPREQPRGAGGPSSGHARRPFARASDGTGGDFKDIRDAGGRGRGRAAGLPELRRRGRVRPCGGGAVATLSGDRSGPGAGPERGEGAAHGGHRRAALRGGGRRRTGLPGAAPRYLARLQPRGVGGPRPERTRPGGRRRDGSSRGGRPPRGAGVRGRREGRAGDTARPASRRAVRRTGSPTAGYRKVGGGRG